MKSLKSFKNRGLAKFGQNRSKKGNFLAAKISQKSQEDSIASQEGHVGPIFDSQPVKFWFCDLNPSLTSNTQLWALFAPPPPLVFRL